jgi:hypothetical protein
MRAIKPAGSTDTTDEMGNLRRELPNEQIIVGSSKSFDGEFDSLVLLVITRT